ncbi:MAG: PAS domain-containing protein [Anaerolineales bacterium]|nr:PAS domain-containing protein [Anaerolineales bacterium]
MSWSTRVGAPTGATSAEEIIGKSDHDFHRPELADRYRADEERVINEGVELIANIEPVLDPRDGKRLWYATTKVPWRNADGEIIGIAGIGRDITERKQVEELLENRERLLQAVLDALSQLLQSTTLDDSIETALAVLARR